MHRRRYSSETVRSSCQRGKATRFSVTQGTLDFSHFIANQNFRAKIIDSEDCRLLVLCPTIPDGGC